MQLPDKLNRKAVVSSFDNLSPKTWEYLFDHEKENGLAECRTKGWDGKRIWYATKPLMTWLVVRCYYMPHEFDEKNQSISQGPFAALNIKRHAIAA